MKKSDYRGWKDVFLFSFMQGVKQKAYIGLLVVVSLFVLFGPLVMNLVNGDEGGAVEVSVEKLVVFDELDFPIDYKNAFAEGNCEKVLIEVSPQGDSKAFDEYIQRYEEQESLKEMAVRITFDPMGGFFLKFVKPVNADLSEDECNEVVEAFDAFFTEEKLQAVDVSEEQMAFLNQPIGKSVVFTSATGSVINESEKTEGVSMEQYYVLLGGIMVSMMLINMSGGSIAGSIVTEKSTRVVEYMMINVRPMALIVGKVLSALLLAVIQFAVYGSSMLLSTVLQGAVLGTENAKSLSETISILAVFEGVNVGNVILSVLILLMGVLFFGILAGLAGASVSKIDELPEGMKVYQFALVIGCYIGIGICIMEMMGGLNPMVITICSLIPISTPFVVPVALLMGRCSAMIAMIGLVLMTVLTAALYLFTANVYEAMIFYNGKVLKPKDILQIAKERRGGAR